MQGLNLTKEKELFVDMAESGPESLRNHVDTQRILDNLNHENHLADIVSKERESIIRMRRTWSSWLLVSIMLIVFFDIFLILAIGFSWMTFPEGYFVPVFVSESLLKIFGLAVIVVKFLFNENSIK
ncbi:hypothetical protein HOD30_01580 [Candidatus Peregrinibacteria bacterium]|jgi:hypothetical protein|nr:hypothetical protein [Candidatus Peregrinibacteria bacterium]MBT4632205.1 hypothetical protein [Candidatus Peregrinibacteria bacterium]MBT5516957.1 hypothetical protein [Candidatus Peregrinibacteria bacterium]MBT5824384.1 hypothetical protein [Candidatus Peregrinibacteria bacterium]